MLFRVKSYNLLSSFKYWIQWVSPTKRNPDDILQNTKYQHQQLRCSGKEWWTSVRSLGFAEENSINIHQNSIVHVYHCSDTEGVQKSVRCTLRMGWIPIVNHDPPFDWTRSVIQVNFSSIFQVWHIRYKYTSVHGDDYTCLLYCHNSRTFYLPMIYTHQTQCSFEGHRDALRHLARKRAIR